MNIYSIALTTLLISIIIAVILGALWAYAHLLGFLFNIHTALGIVGSVVGVSFIFALLIETKEK